MNVKWFGAFLVTVTFLTVTLLPAQVVQQPSPGPVSVCAFNTTPPTLSSGQAGMIQCGANGSLLTTITPSGTQDVNQTQVNGVAVATGNGVVGTGVQRVAIASDNTGFAVNSTLSAETTKVIGTVNQGTSPWVISGTVTVSPASAIAPVVSTAAEANHVMKASAGSLLTLTTTIGATSGYLLIFNATSAPIDGAVAPLYCAPVTSNGTNGSIGIQWQVPLSFSTGITASFSTTGCFTKTASATANFFGQVQ